MATNLPLLTVSALALAAAASATPFDPVATGLFPDRSLCAFDLADANGQAWSFDLSPVGGQTLSYAAGGYTYNFSLCGVAGGPCVPTMGQLWPLASGYQIQGAESGQCYSSKDGWVPCSSFCEGLSVGPPLHTLLDPMNGNGGIMTSYLGMWTVETDGQKCGNVDPVTGKELGRSLQITHFCNASIPAGQVQIQGQNELPQCHYILTVASAAACATKAASPPPVPLPLPGSGPLPVYVPGQGPLAPYLCSPVLSDSAGKAWNFSFSQLFAGAGDYSIKGPDGTTFDFNVCGYTSTTCTPAYEVAASFGGVVATWGSGTPPPAGSDCYWSNGTAAPCTAPCRTLADAVPVFSLTTPSNGATGGVTMALLGEFANADEPEQYQCAFDPLGNPIPNSVVVQLACDPSTPPNKLIPTGVVSSANCTYTISAKTGAACG